MYVCAGVFVPQSASATRVAPATGEGLSRLFVASGLEAPEVAEQLKLADSMGKFLQKTNIIRDYLEDYVDGRAFWPQDVWRQYAPNGELGDFAKAEHGTAARCLYLHCGAPGPRSAPGSRYD